MDYSNVVIPVDVSIRLVSIVERENKVLTYDSTSDHLRLVQNSATLSVCRYCFQGVSELCLTLVIAYNCAA